MGVGSYPILPTDPAFREVIRPPAPARVMDCLARQTVKVNLRSYARAGGEVIAQRMPYHHPKITLRRRVGFIRYCFPRLGIQMGGLSSRGEQYDGCARKTGRSADEIPTIRPYPFRRPKPKQR